ncbi:transcriptional regulator [Acidovorax sp. CF316]|uniref:MarR family winged helix-turn-helix transcriptional regulator n=1 Tax=Acidovorax sp. CF316 TaxID=1144317 RepID=UPI00026BC2ED|nr:MarR family winged helix-turn-helix transcriptional regulator [Acidovorax sp. CF316]EJE53087.1 transcriptional regulator [Acidovorax sp. CF316]
MATGKQSPIPLNEPYRLDQSLGYLLNRSADIVSATFADILKKHHLSLPEWRVLTALTDGNDQTLSELAAHAGTELSYLSRVVLQAQDRGLVLRFTSAADKRATRVSITADGRALVREVMPQARALEASWLHGIPTADVDTMRRTLRALYHNVLNSHPDLASSGRKLTVARRMRKRSDASGEDGPASG